MPTFVASGVVRLSMTGSLSANASSSYETGGGLPASPMNDDWTARISSGGVFFTQNFNDPSSVFYDSVANSNQAVQANIIRETSRIRGGSGALKILHPDSSGSNSGAMRFDLGQLRGNGTTTYYQFTYMIDENQARYSANYGGDTVTGSKLCIISAYSSSNFNNEIVLENTEYKGFADIYYQNGTGFSHDGFQNSATTPEAGSSNLRLTNGIDAGSPTAPTTDRQYAMRYGALYKLNTTTQQAGNVEDVYSLRRLPTPTAMGSGMPWLEPWCWYTYLVKVSIGTLGTASSSVDVWGCKTGRPYKLLHSASGMILGTDNGGHRGFWALNYETSKVANTRGFDGQTIHAEIIASSSSIAAPMQSYISSGLPYTLPSSSGQVTTCGPSTGPESVAPGTMTASNFVHALFRTYGAGVFVEEFSPLGGYAMTGGGHTNPYSSSVAIFDFTTATWSRVDPQSGGTAWDSNTAYAIGATDGSPYYEFTGSSGVPAPGHPFGCLAVAPPSSTRTKGGLAWITRSAISNSPVATGAAHVCDLSTGVWSRLTTGQATTYNGDSYSVWDSYRRRWWHIPNGFNGGGFSSGRLLQYLDANDFTWKSVTLTNIPSPNDAIQRGGVCFYRGYILRQGYQGQGLFIFDPEDTSGWTFINITLPSEDRNCLVWHEGNNKLYYMPSAGGSTMTVVTPPTTNLKTGTWTVSTLTLSQSLPESSGYSTSKDHYRCLVYVPSINRLAWFPGSNYTYLIHGGS